MISSWLGLTLAVHLLGAAPPADPTSARALVDRMRARHGATWYRTVTFVQATTFIQPDGSREVRTWHEAGQMPGRLRIDFDSVASGSGMIQRGDSAYGFTPGRPPRGRIRPNPLLELGFDLYFVSTDTTLARLVRLGIDTTIVRQDRWQGRAAYVIGARAGDERTPQVWFDRGRLVFTRLIEHAGPENAGLKIQEVQFNRYRKLGRGYIAPEVIVKVDGKVVMTEVYRDMRADVPLAPDTFDPGHGLRKPW